MHTIFIIVLFLAVKIFQWINGFIFAHIFGVKESFVIMIGMLLFVAGIFIFGLLVKKFLPPRALPFGSVVVAFALIVSSFIHPLWTVIFLAGIFLYALIAMEAQVLQSFASITYIPRFAPLLAILLPIALSYQFPQTRAVAPQLFYIISSAFAFFASYSARLWGGGRNISYKKAPPVLLGLFFLAGSGLLAYLWTHNKQDVSDTMLLAFILLFYIGGTFAIYASIDEYMRQTREK